MTIFILIILFVCIAILPMFLKPVENNVELFLFFMGIVTAAVAGAISPQNITHILENPFLYIITAAVFFISLLFGLLENRVTSVVEFMVEHFRVRVIIFLIIVILGLLSSIMTAIVASLLLVEMLTVLPIERKSKVRVSVVACFSIGLGAVLTPIGEPLATIVTSKLHQSFLYMLELLGGYSIVGVILLGILGMFLVPERWRDPSVIEQDMALEREKEDLKAISIRSGKIFLFVVGLDLLGLGFKPVIDAYIIHWSTNLLYAVNTVSAILDNATLAAAEVDPVMTTVQIKAVLISLLISGGMMVTGNIPNIVTASKLNIRMKQWAVIGLPIGVVFLVGYYLVIFVFHI